MDFHGLESLGADTIILIRDKSNLSIPNDFHKLKLVNTWSWILEPLLISFEIKYIFDLIKWHFFFTNFLLHTYLRNLKIIIMKFYWRVTYTELYWSTGLRSFCSFYYNVPRNNIAILNSNVKWPNVAIIFHTVVSQIK